MGYGLKSIHKQRWIFSESGVLLMKRLAYPFACFVLLLASLPWLFTSCQPGSLLPNEFIEERAGYDATVSMAQDATSEAMRQAQSTVMVEPIKTLASAEIQPPTDDSNSTIESEVQIFTISPQTKPAEITTPIPVQPSSTVEPTNMITQTPTSDMATTVLAPSTPIGMIDVEDILTEAMLVDQLREDDDENDLTNVRISISEQGLTLSADLDVFAGIKQNIHAEGSFTVKEDNLVVEISSIKLENSDVTRLYKKNFESRVATSLYKLLPLRYVQGFEMRNGEVIVRSKMRP